eukprot:6418035-Amphidinium_carterae.1
MEQESLVSACSLMATTPAPEGRVLLAKEAIKLLQLGVSPMLVQAIRMLQKTARVRKILMGKNSLSTAKYEDGLTLKATVPMSPNPAPLATAVAPSQQAMHSGFDVWTPSAPPAESDFQLTGSDFRQVLELTVGPG